MIDGTMQAFPSGIRGTLPPTYAGGSYEQTYQTLGMTVRQYAAIHIGAALLANGLRSGQDMTQLEKVAVEFTDRLLKLI